MVSSLFLRQQLEHLQSRIVEQSFPSMLIANGTLLPINNEGGAGADTIAYSIFTKVGEAAILANGATDIPEVTAFMEKRYAQIYTLANQYSYSIQDLEHAAFARVNIDARLALAAREVMEREIDTIGYIGKSTPGTRLLGFLNQPNVPVFVLPNDGNSNGGVNSVRFRHKTAAQIYRDLVNFVSSIRRTTRGVEIPDTILMPIEQYEIINSLPYPENAASGETVLTFFLKTQRASGGVSNIIPTDYLTAYGVGDTDMMVAYNRSDDRLAYHIPQDVTTMPQEYRGMRYYYPLKARIGGVVVLKPMSMSYAFGI